ncbi:MAG: histidine kinase [Bacteroidales bacterium]
MRTYKTIFVLLLLVSGLMVDAQTSNSYVRKKSEVNPGQLSVPLLLDSAKKTLANDRNTTFKLLEQAYFLSLDQTHSNQQHLVLKALGDYYRFYKQHDLAALNYKNSFKAVPQGKNSSELLLLAANQYLQAGSYRAVVNLLTSYQAALSNEQQASSFLYLGSAYKNINEADSALFFFKKAQPILTKSGQNKDLLSLKLKMAEVYGMQGKSDLQYKAIKSVMDEATDATGIKLRAYANLADYYKKTNDSEKEISTRQKLTGILETAAETGRLSKDSAEIQLTKEKIALAEVYNDLKQYRQALNILNELQTSGKASRAVLELQKEVVKAKSEAYLHTGQQQKALKNYEQYTAILDQLYKESELDYQNVKELNRQLSNQQSRIEFLEKDKSIYDAEMQAITQEKHSQQQKIQYQRRYIIFLVIALMLLVIVIILLTAKNRIQRRHNDYLALKSLRSQINPHFIFNSLNSLNHFIAKNDEVSANKYLSGFSKLMRNVLHQADKDFIPLEKELDILENYLKMEKMRFPETFVYTISVHNDIRQQDFYIPPMLIQPHIENAIWHGLRYKEDRGELWVDFTLDGELLKVTIRDNGIGRQQSEKLKTEHQTKKVSRGIEITQKRLSLLSQIYKKKIRQQLSDLHENGSGTKVEIWIPPFSYHHIQKINHGAD